MHLRQNLAEQHPQFLGYGELASRNAKFNFYTRKSLVLVFFKIAFFNHPRHTGVAHCVSKN